MLILRRINWRKSKRRAFLIVFILFAFCLPRELFHSPYATVVEDDDGALLMATIASDGQWRFPPGNEIPDKFETALIEFEDQHFYSHIGVSFVALIRASMQNISKGKVVSGGSTLSMQVIRMSRNRKGRALKDKLIEMFMAVRLEWRYSKSEIIELHAAHAPFGGNVVGLEAASWRYFGHKPSQLSWAEATNLAVLPNSPSLIHPGKNRERLLAKRNRLLKRLWEDESMSALEYQTALAEPLPDKPLPLPQLTPHYLTKLNIENPEQRRFKTSIRRNLQRSLNRLSDHHHQNLSSRGIENHGIIVLDVKSGEVISYVGNAANAKQASFVDVIQAPRSTGSILKPFLYAGAMEKGQIAPQMLLADYPTRIHGYTPHNYEDSYDGMVKASEALSRSLNIPAVRLLSDFGVSRFKNDLEGLGLSTLFRSSEDYGLSLILGGAEATLWDLSHAYRQLALSAQKLKMNSTLKKFDPAVAYEILEALSGVNRPGQEKYWERFDGHSKIAWKTGTSYGARDGWAIGLNADYVVAVWVGNANGEGVAGMTGSNSAGPILFDVFRMLPGGAWFTRPVRHMQHVRMCEESGQRAGLHCPKITEQWIPNTCLVTSACTFHQVQFTNLSGTKVVFRGDEEVLRQTVFTLPVAAAFYYKMNHPEYKKPPSARADGNANTADMDVMYPQPKTKIRIPKLMNGEFGSVVFEAVHQVESAELHWFIDNNFITSTKDIHQVPMRPKAGKHLLTVTDHNGLRISRHFEVLYSERI